MSVFSVNFLKTDDKIFTPLKRQESICACGAGLEGGEGWDNVMLPLKIWLLSFHDCVCFVKLATHAVHLSIPCMPYLSKKKNELQQKDSRENKTGFPGFVGEGER